MLTIAYFSGFWGPNIGNAFYNQGVLHALKTALPHAKIALIGDHPGWFWKHGTQPNATNVLIDDIVCDYIVLSGPIFNDRFPHIWADSLRKIRARGAKILMLSVGANQYTLEEYNRCRPLLEECKPYLIMTRDSATYKMYSHFAEHSHDGICFAFFCDEYLSSPIEIDSTDIILNFDKGHDYNVLDQYGPAILRLLNDQGWSPTERLKKLKRDKAASQIATYHGYRVVRTYHETIPPLWQKLVKSYFLGYNSFQRPNSYVADIPEGYLHLYKHAKLTISERVHACVAAIAFGNYAWLISNTKRSRLFSRLGLANITKYPIRGNVATLESEKIKMIEYLRNVL